MHISTAKFCKSKLQNVPKDFKISFLILNTFISGLRVTELSKEKKFPEIFLPKMNTQLVSKFQSNEICFLCASLSLHQGATPSLTGA